MRTYRQRAEESFAREMDPEFYDIGTPPNPDAQEIELHFPDAPRSESFRTAAGSLARMGGAVGGAAIGGAVAAAPMIARTIDAAGPTALSLLSRTARVGMDYGPTVLSGTATGAGMMVRGVVTGGQIAAQTIATAAEFAQALAPASHRGRDFMGSNGVRFAPSLARLMSEHHI